MQNLIRRGFDLGSAPQATTPTQDPLGNWRDGMPCKLTAICDNQIQAHSLEIKNTEALVLSILEGESAESALDQPPYQQRLSALFEPLGAAFNEGDDQEVETVMFDTLDGSAEDLWMKVSWLSFHDEDASIRFRFSFGVDLAEDVAADPTRQQAAAKLAEAVFPESAIITKNPTLLDRLRDTTEQPELCFVERIVYFNAPNGGAYLHHDLERGHAGVVYAQVSGSTLWLALSQQRLVEEVSEFIRTRPLPSSLNNQQQRHLNHLARDHQRLSDALNSFADDALIHLINETEGFVQRLIGRGYYHVLKPGDVILLPQQNASMCCWHSVFCLGEEVGQALSFAIR